MAGNVVNIKAYIPHKLHNGLTGNYHAICHYSYNLPCAPGMGINYRVKVPSRPRQAELLASGKCCVARHRMTRNEVEGMTKGNNEARLQKSCTDGQEPHIKAGVFWG